MTELREKLLELFARTIEKRKLSAAELVHASEAELAAAVSEVAACREELNAPDLDDEATPLHDETDFTEGLRDELSGKRFPDLRGVLGLLADGLRKHPGIAAMCWDRCRISAELCDETGRQDSVLTSVIGSAFRLYLGSRDLWTILFSTRLALCQRVLCEVRQRLRPGSGEDPLVQADLDTAFSDLLDEEISPEEPRGRVRTVLARLAQTFLSEPRT